MLPRLLIAALRNLAVAMVGLRAVLRTQPFWEVDESLGGSGVEAFSQLLGEWPLWLADTLCSLA